MVFFTSILIVTILYYLQADGFIYVTVIALTAELFNIFLTHTVAKSVESKIKARHERSVQRYIQQIKASQKNIKELTKIQDDAGSKLYKANSRIKELEQQLNALQGGMPPSPIPQTKQPPTKTQKKKTTQKKPVPPAPTRPQDHLPAGSKRKQLPI